MPPKRKLLTGSSSSTPPTKKIQTTLSFAGPPSATAAAPATSPALVVDPKVYDSQVVNRKYYPPVISPERVQGYLNGTIKKPIDELKAALCDTAKFRANLKPAGAVVHWFRTDLRMEDNSGLHKASKLGVPVIALYVHSPQDLEAHVVAPAKTDFMIRSLGELKKELAEKNIPLWVETVEKRKDIPKRITELVKQWNANVLFANMEYEVDELRRDTKLIKLGMENDIAVNIVHDVCAVPPGELVTKSTKTPFTVFSPWFRAYCFELFENPALLNLYPSPADNPPSFATEKQKLFTSPLPSSPLDIEKISTLITLFPAGASEANSRLKSFLETKGKAYQDTRNTPSIDGTSSLSPYFAAGCLSSRTAIHHAKASNNGRLSGGGGGIDCWISEVGWRDFYKHVIAGFPHVCMNTPFKPLYTQLPWLPDPLPHFTAWRTGLTGYPFIDAAMRHLSFSHFMPNRLRMVTATFLCKDLHIDWRLGEAHFSSLLIDGDFSANNGGWSWCASVGVDAQPYFRIFNPMDQGRKWDKEGEYIRRWVPELKDVVGDEIHWPSDNIREKMGYPKAIVDHKVESKIAVEAYKAVAKVGKEEKEKKVERAEDGGKVGKNARVVRRW
ncbi:putative deoxyribodipyrimidine photo-lyase Phr1 [Pyronema domesticum]|nr:putative deoxyribodipyrimidine photo-lyase Phr1 [Pyronema domesticum]